MLALYNNIDSNSRTISIFTDANGDTISKKSIQGLQIWSSSHIFTWAVIAYPALPDPKKERVSKSSSIIFKFTVCIPLLGY